MIIALITFKNAFTPGVLLQKYHKKIKFIVCKKLNRFLKLEMLLNINLTLIFFILLILI